MLVFSGTDLIIRNNRDLDTVLTIPERPSFGQHIKLISRFYRRYDIAVSLLPGDRPVLYSWLFGLRSYGPVVSGVKHLWKRILLSKSCGFDGHHRHTLTMYHEVVIDLVGDHIPGPSAPNEKVLASHLLDKLRQCNAEGNYAIIHLTPKFRYKEWPSDKWCALIDRLLASESGVIITGIDEGKRFSDVMKRYDSDDRVVNLVDQLSIEELVFVLKRGRRFFGTDTAVTHLAAALGISTVAIFGPSSPVVWGPWPSGYSGKITPWRQRGTQRVGNVTIVQGSGDCVPCLEEGCFKHISSESDCLKNLAVIDVVKPKTTRTIN